MAEDGFADGGHRIVADRVEDEARYLGPVSDPVVRVVIEAADGEIGNAADLSAEPQFLRELSVGELLAKAIRFTHSEQSVSSLFD